MAVSKGTEEPSSTPSVAMMAARRKAVFFAVSVTERLAASYSLVLGPYPWLGDYRLPAVPYLASTSEPLPPPNRSDDGALVATRRLPKNVEKPDFMSAEGYGLLSQARAVIQSRRDRDWTSRCCKGKP